MELDDTASVLARSDFFSSCTDEQLRLLAFASERRNFSAGEILFKQGENAEGAFVLVSGRVEAAGDLASKGRPFREGTPGAVLGHLGLILARPRISTLRAASPVEAIFVPRSAFSKLLKQNPELAADVAAHIEEELEDYLGALAPFGRTKSAGS